MRKIALQLLVAVLSLPLLGQTPSTRRIGRPIPPSMQAGVAESAVKQAMEQLVAEKKLYDRDLDVLRHLRSADEALTDPMQPNNAIQKGIDEVEAAKGANPEFLVMQGIIKTERDLEGARLSPLSADFGRLRNTLQTEAIGPATRVVARNGAKLQEDILAWIKVQELISSHTRSLAETGAESLRAVQ